MIARNKQPFCIETEMESAPWGRNHRNLVCVLVSYRTFSQRGAFRPKETLERRTIIACVRGYFREREVRLQEKDGGHAR